MQKLRGSEKSLVFFGLYLAISGFALILVPNLMLGLLGIPETAEPWIRVVGFLAVVLAYYYYRVLQARYRPFYVWTVHTRVLVLPFYGALVALELAAAPLLILGVFELACACWTWLALRREG